MLNKQNIFLQGVIVGDRSRRLRGCNVMSLKNEMYIVTLHSLLRTLHTLHTFLNLLPILPKK